MKPPRQISQREKILFPIAGFLIAALIAPGSIALVGMLFFGNLLKESGVTERLAGTARTAMVDRHGNLVIRPNGAAANNEADGP